MELQERKMTTIYGKCPSKSNCYRIGKGRMYKSAALKKYEESFMYQCGAYRGLNIDEPFELYLDVYYPTKSSDLDNSTKGVLDILQAIGAIKNDNNCCKIVARKFIDKKNPRIEFAIEKAM